MKLVDGCRTTLGACALALASVFPAAGTAEGVPALVGDGKTDDTAAIQARLDSGATLVYLPPPAKAYVISKTLRIGSGQELRLDRHSVIRLAPNSDCPMLENRAYRGGLDRSFTVSGGVWDMDNLRQRQIDSHVPELWRGRPKRHEPGYFLGMAMRFANVEGMALRDVTFRNPVLYAAAFSKVSYFTVADIVFDYRTWRTKPLNMDGIHVDGCCHHGRITNLRGTCYDDMVALLANDTICAVQEGPVTDIDVDGIYAEFSHSAVRLLSAGEPVKRITIRNVHGNFYTYTVGLTWYPGRPGGVFEDIVIEDVFAAKALTPKETGGCDWRGRFPIVNVEGPAKVGSLIVSRVHRDERTLPSPTFGTGKDVVIDRLVVRDCHMENRLNEPIPFLDVKGRVKESAVERNALSGFWTGCRLATEPEGVTPNLMD